MVSIIDVACLVARIEQINREQEPSHWLWDRIMSCDVPRLRDQLTPRLIQMLDEFNPSDHSPR